jgi:hypothetical protein
MKITKNTTLGDLLDVNSKAINILNKYMGQVSCLTCPGRAQETLEMGALVHGVSKKDFQKMLMELKKL